MKRAFIVCGPEGSGTKLFTEVFTSQGCFGDTGNEQRLDKLLVENSLIEWKHIVLRRSFPHGSEWPCLEDLLWQLRQRGFENHVIVTIRDWKANIGSQCHLQTHSYTTDHALWKMRRAYGRIFAALLTTNVSYTFAIMDSLIARGPAYGEWLCHAAGLEEFNSNHFPLVQDANAKWYRLVSA